MRSYLKLLRVSHYMKNILIFAPLFFSKNIFDLKDVLYLIYMLIPFSLISSVIYIINDINDVDKDRLHPKKCKRPIASGEISIKKAKVIAIVLSVFIMFMVCITFLFDIFSPLALILLALYFSINFLYSNGMKNIPILDIVILSSGYLIRIFYGASIIGVAVSPWLYLTILTGSLYLGMGKRRNELKCSENSETRKVLKYYNYEFLDKNMHMCVGLAITFYALWAIQTEYVGMIWTVPLVIIILMKYSLDIESEESEGNPMEVVSSDKVLLILAVIYVAVSFAIVYLM